MVDDPRLTRRQLLAAPMIALPLVSNQWMISLASQATPMASPTPHLLLEPAQARYDEPFRVSIGGVEPGTEVSIRASFLDGRARTWRAEATWIASAWGTIDCSADLPIAGDFEVADSMAFIWAASGGAQTWYLPSLFGATPVTFTAHISDQEVRGFLVIGPGNGRSGLGSILRARHVAGQRTSGDRSGGTGDGLATQEAPIGKQTRNPVEA